MRVYLGISLMLLMTSKVFAADCIYYKDPNRSGDKVEQNYHILTGNFGFMEPGFEDAISSVWVRDRDYALLTEHWRFQGSRLYLYGNGWAYKDGQWIDGKSKSADGGAWFNVIDLGFNDKISSFSCLVGG